MTVPLVALAVLSVVGGWINTPFRLGLEHFLEPAFEGVTLAHAPGGATPWILAIVSVAAAAAGIAFATRRYYERPVPDEASFVWRVSRGGYYLDDVYGNVIVLPSKLAAAWTAFVADQRVIDGIVNGVGHVVRRIGAALRPLQSGYVRNYGAVVMVGTVALLAWFLLRSGVG